MFEEPLVESKKKSEEPSKAEFKSKREMTNPFVISQARSEESCKPSPLNVVVVYIVIRFG